MRGRDQYWYDVAKEVAVNAKHRPPRPLVFEGRVLVRQFETAHRTVLQFGRGACATLGEFAHFTMTIEQLRFMQRGSMKANHSDPFARKDYVQLRALLHAHLQGSGADLRQHKYCAPPTWYNYTRPYLTQSEAFTRRAFSR